MSGRWITAGVLVAATVFAPAAHAAEKDCSSVSSAVAKASSVKASSGLRCRSARRVIRLYFKKVGGSAQTVGGCAQRRLSSGCRVGAFRCFTKYSAETNSLRGRCKQGRRYVRFRETDYGPG